MLFLITIHCKCKNLYYLILTYVMSKPLNEIIYFNIITFNAGEFAFSYPIK